MGSSILKELCAPLTRLFGRSVGHVFSACQFFLAWLPPLFYLPFLQSLGEKTDTRGTCYTKSSLKALPAGLPCRHMQVFERYVIKIFPTNFLPNARRDKRGKAGKGGFCGTRGKGRIEIRCIRSGHNHVVAEGDERRGWRSVVELVIWGILFLTSRRSSSSSSEGRADSTITLLLSRDVYEEVSENWKLAVREEDCSISPNPGW